MGEFHTYLGQKDTIIKNYMSDCHIFADIFNYLIYHGKQEINPEQLHPMDSTIIGVPYGYDESIAPVQKYRDGLKYLTLMEDTSTAYLLLGTEHQTNIHYAMPVKDMAYDALQYAAQVNEASKVYRKKSRRKCTKLVSDEYLSGFRKKDHLLPVVTVTLYWGSTAWDAPLNLHDMFCVNKPEILTLVPDYQINLIAPVFMEDREIDKFQTSLREVFYFIKYAKDKVKLAKILASDERFQKLEKQAVMVINTVAGVKLQFNENEEVIDVCKAINDMKRDARREGLQHGCDITNLSSIKNLMKNKGWSAEESMLALGLSDLERIKYQEMLFSES